MSAQETSESLNWKIKCIEENLHKLNKEERISFDIITKHFKNGKLDARQVQILNHIYYRGLI